MVNHSSKSKKRRITRKGRVYLLIVASLAFFTNCSKKLTIGIIGDQFGAVNADSAFVILDQAVARMNKVNPDITLHVGDMVESIQNVNSYEDYQKIFQHAVNIMNQLYCPWIFAIGDHDVVPPIYKPLSEDRSREKWFLDQSTAYSLKNNGKLYYSYDIKGYHFIALYSLENLHTDPRWGSIFLNQISEEQIAWLKNDLSEHKKTNGIIVVIHHPQWYVWQNWSTIHDMLKSYPVIAVIAGHYHYDQNDGVLDGIQYFTMGSTGGVIKDLDENSGGCYEYAVMNIKGRKIKEMHLYNALTGNEVEITPRKTMDRIQAIACMLGNLSQDELIYLDQNYLMSPDKYGKMHRLDEIGLESLCNPIDLPIQVQINYNKDFLYEASWTDTSICGDSVYTLNPGERTGWANYSSVGQWFKPQALWTAKVNFNNVINNHKIDLNGWVSFTDTRERVIKNTTTYHLLKKDDKNQ